MNFLNNVPILSLEKHKNTFWKYNTVPNLEKKNKNM